MGLLCRHGKHRAMGRRAQEVHRQGDREAGIDPCLRRQDGLSASSRLGVLETLGMGRTELRGSPAHAVWSTVVRPAGLFPGAAPAQLIRPPPLAEATRPRFADLARVLPDIGRFDTNPWGLTFEIRDHEQPHWTGQRNSLATFGHFGGTGTFCARRPDWRRSSSPAGTSGLGPWRPGPASPTRCWNATLRSVRLNPKRSIPKMQQGEPSSTPACPREGAEVDVRVAMNDDRVFRSDDAGARWREVAARPAEGALALSRVSSFPRRAAP